MLNTCNESVYLNALRDVLLSGHKYTNHRTGAGVLSLHGLFMKFDVRYDFPLLTTKRVHYKSVLGELLWFISGSTHNDDLRARGVTIWDEWATAEKCAKFGREPGDLGPIYGKQWRSFGKSGVDQLQRIINGVRTDPTSRRLVMSAWNPEEVDDVELPPCHTLAQFLVRGSMLSCHVYQRSGDMFLGVPFNMASYATLLHLVAYLTAKRPGKLTFTIGDAHIYEGHTHAVREQLNRQPRLAPKLIVKGESSNVDDYNESHFELVGYNPHPTIKAEVVI